MNAAPFLVLVAGRGFIFLPFYVCICNQQSRVSDLPSVCCTLLAEFDTLKVMIRALIVVRLSMHRDQSTSPERQREHCRNLIQQRGWTEVGVAEDLAVSATKYSPFDRPALGDWLANRHHEFDQIVVWRLDRLVRSSKDLADLLTWCEKHGKGLVSATEGFDLDTPFGKAMVAIIAALGQLEADTVRMRVADAHRALRQTDRWAAGKPPFGFRVVDHPSGKGKALAQDPEQKKILHEAAEKLLSGWSFTAITVWMSERTGREWNTTNVINCLTNLKTQGIKMRTVRDPDGKNRRSEPVLDAEGNWIELAPPIFDWDTWEQIQQAAAARRAAGRRRSRTKNPMLGVGQCALCGASLAQQWTTNTLRDGTVREYRSYRCARTPINCRGVSIPADQADEILEQEFLDQKGSDRVEERVWQVGSDNSAELDRVNKALELLRAEADAGLVDDQDEYLSRLKSLTAKKRELESQPIVRSGWVTRYREETYADVWANADAEERRKLLVDAGVRFVLTSRHEWELQVPEPSVTPEEQEAYRREHGIVFES